MYVFLKQCLLYALEKKVIISQKNSIICLSKKNSKYAPLSDFPYVLSGRISMSKMWDFLFILCNFFNCLQVWTFTLQNCNDD